MKNKMKKPGIFESFFGNKKDLKNKSESQCSSHSCSCGSSPVNKQEDDFEDNIHQLLNKKMGRRKAIATAVTGAAAVSVAAKEVTSVTKQKEDKEISKLKFEEYFKKNYRVMTREEQKATVKRLEKLAYHEYGKQVNISSTPARDNVLYGYAFNISKCQGYMDCISACLKENNQDRDSNMQYIKMWEMKNGDMNLESANGNYYHEVPVEGHFYMGTQCFHCENPPCTKVCPVGATWKEKDGIVVVDYDWCIGCRYCEAACPYFGRRFNWGEPNIPTDELNTEQHYLGNRPRQKGVMEKCTFCIQRSRDGQNPACVEACPTGSRIFGNLLDPNSDIRYVLENKKVFRLKEDLGTEPKFWYYMD